jgi:hypothetical protein
MPYYKIGRKFYKSQNSAENTKALLGPFLKWNAQNIYYDPEREAEA